MTPGLGVSPPTADDSTAQASDGETRSEGQRPITRDVS